MQIQKTVFISYRRSNIPIAQAVRLSLIAQGFDVFLDFESINSGSFGEAILQQIAARAHFVLLLTPSALENCLNPDDWVRREIEEAIKLKRNIVPLLFDGFEFKAMESYLQGAYLPLLSAYNGLKIHWDMFDQSMEKLSKRYLNIPLEMVSHPLPNPASSLSNLAPSPEQLKAQEYFERGISQNRIGDWDAAIKEFDRALLLDETFAEALFKRGHSYWSKGEKAQALADWEKAVAIEPKHPKVNVMRAYVYTERGRYKEALAEANAAVALHPQLYEVYSARAWVQFDVQNYRAVIADCDEAARLKPDYYSIYNMRGLAYTAVKDYQAALLDFEQARSLNPNSASVYNNRGLVYYHLQDYQAALSDFETALKLNPSNLRAIVNQANSFAALGDYHAALASYERALALAPESPSLKRSIQAMQERIAAS